MKHIEALYNEALNKLRPHVTPDHLSRNHLGQPLPLEILSPTWGVVPDEGTYVLRTGELFQLCYSERGESRVLLESADTDLILYQIFEGLTQSLATSWECRHRDPSVEDTRLSWFPLMEDLLGVISFEWKERSRLKHQALLHD